MNAKNSKKRGNVHNEALKQALIRLIEINVPSRFASEREMAEALNFSPAHFSQMKNGFRTIGKDSAEKIEKGLQLDVGGLYQYQGDAAVFEMPSTTENIASRYERASEPVRTLIDMALRENSPKPKWVTKAIEYQLKALIEAIAEKTGKK
jgi:transcriptional regulator with XRE-family HTH domain